MRLILQLEFVINDQKITTEKLAQLTNSIRVPHEQTENLVNKIFKDATIASIDTMIKP